MLFAEADASPWWVTLIIAILTLLFGGATGGGVVYQLMKLRLDYKRGSQRDAIADYQKLVDSLESAKEKVETSREKMVADMNATLAENLRLKAMIGDKDAELAALRSKQSPNTSPPG